VTQIICEACGWMAVTTQYAPDVWAEHVAGCPAVGGAVRHEPEPEPLRAPRLADVTLCRHRLVRRHIASLADGTKRFAVVCELCGRRVDPT
jgi:hypothetical protein